MIRPFEPRDRERIRVIFRETADAGNPMGQMFPDREIFSDFWTLYYTDYEPNSLFVAELAGEVVGYLTGCLDEGRFRKILISRIAPRIIWTLFRKKPETMGAILKLLWINLRPSLHQHKIVMAPYSSGKRGHLHLNLLLEARGRGLGAELMRAFCFKAKSAGTQVIRIGVREDNAPARTFFERQGFGARVRRFGYRITDPLPRDYFVIEYERLL